ncbi:unnamed protein product, partial [Meganyctiphanes norvegica]
MNALTVITLAAVAACGSTQYFGYPSLLNHVYHHYGYAGLHHGYTGLHHGYTGLIHGYAPLHGLHHSYSAPYAPIQTQYHSQDELGQYSFGYSGGPSNRAETRDAYGNVRGSYNYIDSNGQTQTQHYVADALGFRVSGTNLPVGPDAPAVSVTAALVAPEPVQDTPEVVAAREEFLALYNEAAAAAAAAPDARKKRSVGSVAIHSAVAPLAYSGIHHGYHGLLANRGLLGHHGLIGHHAGYAGLGNHGLIGHHTSYAGLGHHGLLGHHAGYAGLGYAAAPVAAAAPAAVHDAELLRVENNPGHAVSYRVY